MKLIGGYNDNAKENPLHGYQCEAVDFILDRLYTEDEKGAGLFLDPGLGKTRTTLTVLDLLFKMGAIEKALIIAPLRPLYTVWPNEVREWGFQHRPVILHKQLDKAIHWGRPIELMNFGSLKNIAEYKNRWDIVVVDESTYIKNWSAKRTGFLKKMIKTIPKRIILTGTPAANSLSDLFSQLFIVDDGDSLGRTITKFRAEFCTPSGWQGRQWSVRGGSGVLLNDAIKDRCLRMQCEDYLDMPGLVQNNIHVELPPKIQGQYKRFEKELVAEIAAAEGAEESYQMDLLRWQDEPTQGKKPERPSNLTIYSANASGAYMKCRQFASGPVYAIDEDGRRIKSKTIANYQYGVAHRTKFDALIELTESINGKPIMIAYNFRHELEEILKLKCLDGAKNFGVIQGGMKPEQVNYIIDKWNADKLGFLICQWQAASHGLNLQKGSCGDIICFSLTDRSETYEQLYRRIYRQGAKTKQVRIHRILTLNTVDMVQCERVDGKLTTQKEFLQALKRQVKANQTRKKK